LPRHFPRPDSLGAQGGDPSAYKGNWNVAWTKSGAIVPEKIDGKYWMYWLGTAADKTDQMGLSYSTDLLHWTEATPTPVLPRRPGMFDSRVVEPGPPPVLTPGGIVLIYNGATISSSIAPPSPSSTATIPQNCSPLRCPIFARMKNGKKLARYLT